MSHKFKVGDELVCKCGHSDCVPFIVYSITEETISGIDNDGIEFCYIEEDFPKLFKVTKLDKALK